MYRHTLITRTTRNIWQPARRFYFSSSLETKDDKAASSFAATWIVSSMSNVCKFTCLYFLLCGLKHAFLIKKAVYRKKWQTNTRKKYYMVRTPVALNLTGLFVKMAKWKVQYFGCLRQASYPSMSYINLLYFSAKDML